MRADPGPTRTGHRRGLLAARRIDHRRHQADALRREPTATGVLVDDVLVGCDVDAVDLVGRHVALDPPDLGAEAGDHLVGLGADVVQLLGRQLAGSGQWSFDHVLGHCRDPPAYSWYDTGSTGSSIPPVRDYAYSEYGCQGRTEGPSCRAGHGDPRGPAGGRPRALRDPRLRRHLGRRHRPARRRHEGDAVPPPWREGGPVPRGRGAGAARGVGPRAWSVPRRPF